MFGYVTIRKDDLKVKDYNKYQAYYCGLCQDIKEAYGKKGQAMLTFDMTFLSILLTGLYECETKEEEHYCFLHPGKKHKCLRNKYTKYCADMNVLLAEANVPYEELVDLDDINPQFPQANVALVVGANDVTNPAARRPGTPVSGMPILDVDKSQNVVVMKRGRGMGYAGIQNELYFEDNTQMLFGDAKKSLQSVIAAVKELLA